MVTSRRARWGALLLGAWAPAALGQAPPERARVDAHLTRAAEAARAGDAGTSGLELERALRLAAPDDVRPAWRLARLLGQRGRWREAAALLEKVTRGAPDDGHAWTELAEARLEADDPDAALHALERAEAAARAGRPHATEAAREEATREEAARLRARARAHTLRAEGSAKRPPPGWPTDERDRRRALAAVDRAVRLEPDHVGGRVQRARARAARRDVKGALADLDRAAELAPTAVTTWTARAEVLRGLGEGKAALDAYDVGLRLRPGDPDLLLARSRVCCDLDRPEQAITDLTRALAAFEGDAAVATVAGKRAWRRALRLERARVRLDAELDLPVALEDVTRVVDEAPRDVEARWLRVRVHVTLADWPAVERDLDALLSQDQANARAWHGRAQARWWQERHRDALADFDQAIVRDDQPRWRLDRDRLRSNTGDHQGAMVDLDHVLGAHPRWADVRVERARLHLRIAAWRDALTDVELALAEAPDHADGLHVRGDARAGLGDHAAALVDFDRSLELDPEPSGTYYSRAQSRRRLGDDRGALTDLDAAIARDADWQPYLVERGRTRRALGDLQGALVDLDQAVVLQPDDAAARHERGLVHADLQQVDQAIADFEAALSRDPAHDKARARLRALTLSRRLPLLVGLAACALGLPLLIVVIAWRLGARRAASERGPARAAPARGRPSWGEGELVELAPPPNADEPVAAGAPAAPPSPPTSLDGGGLADLTRAEQELAESDAEAVAKATAESAPGPAPGPADGAEPPGPLA